jgi:hypothetical protein
LRRRAQWWIDTTPRQRATRQLPRHHRAQLTAAVAVVLVVLLVVVQFTVVAVVALRMTH